MFRCHGNISGRAITNALHDMCSKILEEKKKAQESNRKTSVQKPWSDIINTPPPSSARGIKEVNTSSPTPQKEKERKSSFKNVKEFNSGARARRALHQRKFVNLSIGEILIIT